MGAPESTHVAVGVIINERQQVLIAKRHPDSHKGGLWEFPGGKKEESESIEEALKREFAEEIGIEPTRFQPFTKILHEYPDKNVLLDVWLIKEYEGQAQGKEGQEIEWRQVSLLEPADFPEANRPIIRRIRLPNEIAITPDLESPDDFSALLERYADLGLKLVQFRQTKLDQSSNESWLRHAKELADKKRIQLIANQAYQLFDPSLSAGLHVNSKSLLSLQQRPVPLEFLFSASCHCLEELQYAEKMDADFVTLSPVCYTAKYGFGSEMGWDEFAVLAGQVSLPIYALGGIARNDLKTALEHGAYGIAGISAYL